VKVGRENIFKLTIGNESLHEVTNDSGIRVVNFATSKNLVIKSTMFLVAELMNTPGPLLRETNTTRLITF
jgi:hypothetical protein